VKLGVVLVFGVFELLEDGKEVLFEGKLLWGEGGLGFDRVELG
jgi:hypothetical protein